MYLQKYNIKLVKEKRVKYESQPINNVEEMAKQIERMFDLSSQCEEVFVALALDSKLNPIGMFEISRGSLDCSLVHPRELFKRLLLCNASSVCVAHNHPSGNFNPSVEDIKLTERLVECGNLLGVKVIEHLIFGGDGLYFSFAKESLL